MKINSKYGRFLQGGLGNLGLNGRLQGGLRGSLGRGSMPFAQNPQKTAGRDEGAFVTQPTEQSQYGFSMMPTENPEEPRVNRLRPTPTQEEEQKPRKSNLLLDLLVSLFGK